MVYHLNSGFSFCFVFVSLRLQDHSAWFIQTCHNPQYASIARRQYQHTWEMSWTNSDTANLRMRQCSLQISSNCMLAPSLRGRMLVKHHSKINVISTIKSDGKTTVRMSTCRRMSSRECNNNTASAKIMKHGHIWSPLRVSSKVRMSGRVWMVCHRRRSDILSIAVIRNTDFRTRQWPSVLA